MTQTESPLGLPMTDVQYAEEWEQNSNSFKSEGIYNWMSEQLGNVKTVLEIGCGSGNGSIAIHKGNRCIISIEPNTTLADIACNSLISQGVLAEIITPNLIFDRVSRKKEGVFIVNADIFDANLDALLSGLNFDAIVCWLIGAEPVRIEKYLGKPKETFVGPEMAEYRKMVHSRCYCLGKQALSRTGVIHIVDRIGISSWNDKDAAREELAALHTDLAGTTYSVTKKDTFLKRCVQPLQSSRIQYLHELNSGKFINVFASVKSRLNL